MNPGPSISSVNRTKTRPVRSSLAPVIPTHYDDTREADRVRIAKNRRTDEPYLNLFVSGTNRVCPPRSNPKPTRPRPATDPSHFFSDDRAGSIGSILPKRFIDDRIAKSWRRAECSELLNTNPKRIGTSDLQENRDRRPDESIPLNDPVPKCEHIV